MSDIHHGKLKALIYFLFLVQRIFSEMTIIRKFKRKNGSGRTRQEGNNTEI